MTQHDQEVTKTNGKAPTDPMDEQSRDFQQIENDMLYKLKGAIDSRGRYAYRLNDMASGYAAAQGVSPMIARGIIEEKFENTFGRSLQEYLEQHYDQLRANGKDRTQKSGIER